LNSQATHPNSQLPNAKTRKITNYATSLCIKLFFASKASIVVTKQQNFTRQSQAMIFSTRCDFQRKKRFFTQELNWTHNVNRLYLQSSFFCAQSTI